MADVGIKARNLTTGQGGFEELRRNYVYGGKEPYEGPADSATGTRDADRPRARAAYDPSRPMSKVNPAPCGTDAAYHLHIKNKEDVDDACRQAHSGHCTARAKARRRAKRASEA